MYYNYGLNPFSHLVYTAGTAVGTYIYNMVGCHFEEKIAERSKIAEVVSRSFGCFRDLPREIVQKICNESLEIESDVLLKFLSLNRSWNELIEGDRVFKPIIATERAKNFVKNNCIDRCFHKISIRNGLKDITSCLVDFLQVNKEKENYDHLLLEFLTELIANKLFVCTENRSGNMLQKFPDRLLFYDITANELLPTYQMSGTSEFTTKFKSILDQYECLRVYCYDIWGRSLYSEFSGNSDQSDLGSIEDKLTKMEMKIAEVVNWFLNNGYIKNAYNILNYTVNMDSSVRIITNMPGRVNAINYFIGVGQIDKAVECANLRFSVSDPVAHGILVGGILDALAQKYCDDELILKQLRPLYNKSVGQASDILKQIDFKPVSKVNKQSAQTCDGEGSKEGADERNKSGTLANYWFTYCL